MALITHDYYCTKAGMASEFRLLIPDACLHGDREPEGVLFLLPREGESGGSLILRTGLEAVSDRYQLAVVIPPALNGCFTDMVYGYPFYQSLLYVREYLRTYFPGLPLVPGKCAIAGIGISAMAAVRWAAEEPEFFRCAGAISGLFDPAMEPTDYFTEERLTNLFGDPEMRIAKREAFEKIRQTAENAPGCGVLYLSGDSDDPDVLREQLRTFVKHVWGGEA